MRELYRPEPPPADASLLPEYLEREFRRISASIEQVHDYEVLYAEPSKKHIGMERYADGVNWNPGSGKGMYYWDGTFWIYEGLGMFSLEVSKGNIPGHSAVHKFGESTNVDSGTDTDIHDGANATEDIDIWVAPTQARTHQIVSTDANDTSGGTGARTVMIYGLTSWSAEEVSETITMNGTTNVATSNQYVIIHRMLVLTKGATSSNVGDIKATADTDSTLTAMISAGKGQTLMAIYAIPSTKTLYLNKYYASGIKGGLSLSCSVTLLVNQEPETELTNFITKHVNGLSTDGTNYMNHPFDPEYKITGPAIIKVQSNSSSNNTVVSAGFSGYVVDN